MALKLASLVSVVNAGTVTLNWDDCGDADTHTVITDISPLQLPVPGATTLTGSGIVDQDTNAGQFKFDAKVAGVSVLKDGGSLCEDKLITLPLNAGTIKFHGLSCPVSAGEISINLDINLADSGAVSNDLTNIDLSALSDTGDKLMCASLSVDSPSKLAVSDRPDCSAAACEANCECSYVKCSDEVDACLAAPNCASSQDCAFACPCGDGACLLKCAASSPSIKALPLAKCITSNCDAKLEVADRPDCSAAACEANCECSYVKCSDEVDACLAAPNCASSQDCAFACPCGDGACLLKCAASSPSIKALPLAKCITSNCDAKLEAAARPDCSAAACQANCECSYVKCSDEVDACLAAPNCASSQDCAFACPCGDGACLLKCAASSPSIKALPLAKCITSNCDASIQI